MKKNSKKSDTSKSKKREIWGILIIALSIFLAVALLTHDPGDWPGSSRAYDEPTNNSLHTFLNANNKRRNATNRDLYNLMYDMHNFESKGTYSYKGNWNMLDQLIVSQALIRDREGIHLDFTDGKIFREDWMMYSNPKIGETTPNKTYGGVSYFGGVSDHLPVYLILKKGE